MEYILSLVSAAGNHYYYPMAGAIVLGELTPLISVGKH